MLDVVDKRALLAAGAPDRADLAYRAAKLVETELSDPDAAIPRYGAVLQVLPAHDAARAALEALMQHDDRVEAATPILERVYRAERDAAGLIRVYERRLAVAERDPVPRVAPTGRRSPTSARRSRTNPRRRSSCGAARSPTTPKISICWGR